MPIFVHASIGAGALVLLAAGAGRQRRALFALIVALLLAVVLGVRGVLITSDLMALPKITGLGEPLALLLSWSTFGCLARAAGGVRMRGPGWVWAPLAGALFGEWAAAAFLAGLGGPRSTTARWVLAAMGGAMIGRVGDPALLLLGDRAVLPVHALAGLVMVAIAAPPRLAGPGGRRLVAAVASATALGSLFHPQVAVVLGGLALLPLLGADLVKVRLQPVAWCGLSLMVVAMATAAGLPEFAAMGLEQLQRELGASLPYAVGAIGVAGSAICGDVGGAVLGVAVLDRALSLRDPGLVALLIHGLALGGLGPLLVAGVLREGFFRWLLAATLGVCLGAFLLV